MSRLRRTKPQPQLIRATTIQKSQDAVALHWWRYRHHFLEAKLAQLAERQQPDPAPGTDAAGPARSVVLLHGVPLEDQAVFDRYVADALATAQSAAGVQTDPDQVEADMLAALIAEAEGTIPERGGWGFVPDAGGRNYDVSPLPASDPRTQGRVPARHRPAWRTVALAGVVLIGGLGYSGLLLQRHSAGPPAGAAAAAVGTAITASAPADPSTSPPPVTPTPLEAVWDAPQDALRPTSIEIVRSTTFVLPIDAVPGALGAAWTPPLTPGRAAWLEGSVVNLVLCVAPPDHALVTAAQAGEQLTLRIANGETRDYVATAPRVVGRQQREVLDQRHTGLTVVACGASGNDRAVLSAALADPQPPSGAAERRSTTP